MGVLKGIEAAREPFARLLDRFGSVSVVPHVNPDADALGTALGVAYVLGEAGKRVEVCCRTRPLPTQVDFLKGYAGIKDRMEYGDSLVIACDCGSLDRLGFELEGRTIVSIDHHVSHTGFGALNIVVPDAVASAEVAYRLLSPLFPIAAPAAEAFYCAILSDTRQFTTPGVTPETFELVREIIGLGVRPAEVARQMIQRRSLASLRILGRALSSLTLHEEGRVALMRMSREDLEASGAHYSDLDGVVDYARSLVTVEAAALLVERGSGVKVSVRSKGLDVGALAQSLGGGGHRQAGGFELRQSLNEASELVIEKMKELVDKGS